MTQNLNLGTIELRLLLTLEEKGLSVFTIDDAKNILKTTDSSVWHILNGLIHKKRIRRIQRSKYLLIPAKAGIEGYWSESPWVVVPHLIDVYYVGFWTAMNYWGMTEQIPYTVFVATTKRKRNLEFGNQRFEFVTLSKKKFFGFAEEKVNKEESFNISSKEKTIVDGLMHPEYCGGIPEVAKAMWYARKEVNWSIVLDMSNQVGMGVILRRLGYLLDLLEIEESVTRKIKDKTFKGYHFLDSKKNKKRIGYSKNYGLVINRTKNQLLGWRDY
ncbi:MAG: transcriptional regulator [Marine Group I thaumarchaeote]|nr:MAG: transcriptional regulator [Marine Group I thaumarchaeote]